MFDRVARQVHNFLPHTDADRQQMLQTIGVNGVDALFADIPASLRQNIRYQVLPQDGLSELELQRLGRELASENQARGMDCFMGAGAYWRFIPSAIATIASRSEFYTAYTPYQPEISQGTLQYTYEFQSMICELTGMDAANASVYDGASAVTEAALMALRHTKKSTLVIAKTVHPDYRLTLQTYLNALGGMTLIEIDELAPIEPQLKALSVNQSDIAAVIIQQPSFLGTLSDLTLIRQTCDTLKALLIVSADPVSLGLLKAPGTLGADIVVGDIQPLGNNLSYGGPYGGYMATKKDFLRQLPGRIVGRTVDKDGRPCFTLTLQTREQHIRREKATSNICTNQALNILKATVYLTLLGPQGLKHVAELSVQRAHQLAQKLGTVSGVNLVQPNTPFAFEFTLALPVCAQRLITEMAKSGILAGVALNTVDAEHYGQQPNTLLVCCTEMTTPESIERYVNAFQAAIQTILSDPASEASEASHYSNCPSSACSQEVSV